MTTEKEFSQDVVSCRDTGFLPCGWHDLGMGGTADRNSYDELRGRAPKHAVLTALLQLTDPDTSQT